MNKPWSKPQLDAMLFAMLGSKDMVDQWWASSNKAFDGRCPKDVYYRDPQGILEVSDYINSFACGDYR